MSTEIFITLAIFSHIFVVYAALIVFGGNNTLNTFGSVLFFSSVAYVIYTWVSVFV